MKERQYHEEESVRIFEMAVPLRESRDGARTVTAALAAILCIGACQPAASDSAPPDVHEAADTPAALTSQGWGPLRIGMTLEEVTAAAGPDANPNAVGGPDPTECDEFRPTEAPEGMIVMIERGSLTRISIGADSDVKTDRGFGVGDTAEAILESYGAVAVSEPHKYAPDPARYITIWTTPPPAPDARGLLYDIGTDGLVTHVRAGGPSIQYVEGCL